MACIESMKRAVITGGNQGMGLNMAIALLKQGWFVTFSCRSDDKGEAALATIKAELPSAPVDYIKMDLMDFSTIHSFADAWESTGHNIDLLVLNAGIMNTPYVMTVDGFESQFQTNHLGHFLLTHLLFSKLNPSGRVVILSSRAHFRWNKPIDYSETRTETADSYDGWQSYGRSKLCNIYMAKGLAKRFPFSTSGITFNALHPGVVSTGLIANGAPQLLSMSKSVDEGIKCAMYVSTSSDVEGMSGKYYHEDTTVGVAPSTASEISLDEDAADLCWNASMAFLSLGEGEFGKK